MEFFVACFRIFLLTKTSNFVQIFGRKKDFLKLYGYLSKTNNNNAKKIQDFKTEYSAIPNTIVSGHNYTTEQAFTALAILGKNKKPSSEIIKSLNSQTELLDVEQTNTFYSSFL